MATSAIFDMLRQKESPAKGGAKGSVAILKESTQLGCVSEDSYPRKSVLREQGKLGSKHTIIFSKSTWHQIKIRQRKGPSRGTIQKCEPHERCPCAPKFGERLTLGDFAPRKMRLQSSMEFGKNCLLAQECGESYVFCFW